LIKHLLIATFLIGLAAPKVFARGRQPEDQDNYPDYNRLEFRKKAPDPAPEPPAPSPLSVSPTTSPVNPPPKAPSEMDAAPKPPPAAVAVSTNDSEPTLPDDMMTTLVPATTGQK